jgi:TonB-dependent starch-binding outer membrane protein SusC
MKQNYYVLKRIAFVGVLMLSTLASFAQKKVSGKITDGDGGSGLPGVSISVKGTSKGALTDANGNYSLDADAANTLVFSFVGYNTQEVVVGNKATINVILTQDNQSLQEVVVTGYTSQSRKDIISAIAVVDTKEMQKVASSSIGEQLQGRAAGVFVGNTGGPGSAQYVRIRGIGTINSSEPLYVIDGIPLQGESQLNFINPADIESMQILKDAASASAYGTRAANGVILITTKKGKAGNSKISLDVYSGMQTPSFGKFPTLSDPTTLMQIKAGLLKGSGQALQDRLYPLVGGQFTLPDFIAPNGGYKAGDPAVDPKKYFVTPDPTGGAGDNYSIKKANQAGTDWLNELFKPAQMTNYQLAASGGSEKGQFYFSGNYMDHKGTMVKNDYTRYQIRANTTFNVKNRVRVGENVNLAYQVNTARNLGNPAEGTPLVNAIRMPQIVPLYDINGYWGGGQGTGTNASNPVANQYRSATNKDYNFRFFGNVFAEIDIVKNLTLRTKLGANFNQGIRTNYTYRNFEATEVNSANQLAINTYLNRDWTWSNILQYKFNIGDKHNFDVYAGTEANQNTYNGFDARGGKLAFGDDVNYRLLGNSDSKTYGVGGYQGENSLFSQLAGLSYKLGDKYLAEAKIRRDGSSKFINNRWGIFPAGSVGWRISKENFMQGVTFINDLKFRASYGTLGNNQTGDYVGYSNFGTSPGSTSYDLTGSSSSVQAGFDQQSTGNPDLKWETTKMFNVGFDGTLFNALDLTLDWYNRNTIGMIYGVEQPLEAGNIGFIDQNIGDMNNKGWEFSIGYRGKAVANQLGYNVTFNGSANKNEVVRLDANDNTYITSANGRIGDWTWTEAGLPISQYRGYIWDGVYQSESELSALKDRGEAKVGRFKFRDLNNDGIINDKDETFIGSPFPTFTYGMNLNLNYKGFDFTGYLQGVYGNKIVNMLKYYIDFPVFQANYSQRMLTEAGKTLPVLDNSDNYSARKSSFYVEDGSYLRGRNLQLGYTLPQQVVSKIGMDRLRVYLQGQNLFTFTKYTGIDPDVSVSDYTEAYNSRRDLNLGVDFGKYPTSKTVMVGISAEF